MTYVICNALQSDVATTPHFYKPDVDCPHWGIRDGQMLLALLLPTSILQRCAAAVDEMLLDSPRSGTADGLIRRGSGSLAIG